MTTDIKELVKRLREESDHQHDLAHDCDCAPEATANWAAKLDIRSAADALEAMAEKLQREAKAAGYWMERSCAAENERDRLKAALLTIAETIDGFEGRGDYVSYVSFSLDIADIARKALGGDA